MDHVAEINAAEAEQPAAASIRKISPVMLLFVGVFVVIAAFFGIALIRQNQTQPTEGGAPEFTLTTFDNQTLKLSDLRGKVVMINFWASWCGPCRYEAPELEKAWQQYKDRGVVFLGIAYTDTERNAKAYLKDYGVTYTNGLDFGTKISEKYRIQGVPETFIIDRKGNVSEFIMQPVDQAKLSAMLDRALAKQ
ncbi:MAG: TlpA family protein disulfide reductase [Anaerolineae bacterium]|nr:TlpA family protein disulfide reductase [Anaerolineae bacterium]